MPILTSFEVGDRVCVDGSHGEIIDVSRSGRVFLIELDNHSIVTKGEWEVRPIPRGWDFVD